MGKSQNKLRYVLHYRDKQILYKLIPPAIWSLKNGNNSSQHDTWNVLSKERKKSSFGFKTI